MVSPQAGEIIPEYSLEESVYRALCLGVKDYVEKNGFPGVVLGLSGGIDSALVLAIAVDALGADRVRAVMMPSQFTADISLQDAEVMAIDSGRALQRNVRSSRYSMLFSTPWPTNSTTCHSIPPRKTFRRAFAARC